MAPVLEQKEGLKPAEFLSILLQGLSSIL